MRDKNKPDLKDLFLIFLKVGSTAFGGFMALISIVQKELVEKKEIIKNEEILNGISIATVLPGPIAVNVITYLGYGIRGVKGGLISMLAVIIPSFVLILILSVLYFEYGSIPQFRRFFEGVLPAVAAIIFSVAINMSKKNIKDFKQIFLAVAAFALVFFVGGFFITLLIIVFGGIAGIILYKNTFKENLDNKVSLDFFSDLKKDIERSRLWLMASGIVFLIVIFLPLLPNSIIGDPILLLHKLFLTISSVSLTLFGGGYVFIPMLQELVVDNLGWLSNQEFIDGIAMGQITPGPIMISATFIGYKVAGIPGAIIATIAIFLPPGLLVMICSRFVNYFKESALLKSIFKGIHPMVIGMIFAAGVIIALSTPHEWLQLIIFVLSFVLTFWLKVDLVIIIPLAGLLGLILG